MRTIECSCRLWPTPGMYAVTSTWFVSRTRATLRSAEFGFLGVEVKTRTHTPRFCGDPWSAGLSVFERSLLRPTRTSWLTVGTLPPSGNERGGTVCLSLRHAIPHPEQPSEFTGKFRAVKGVEGTEGTGNG